ncbi:GmrSD restriction endonuclease domain-containing protein [Paraburkholderia strydomiana]|uniref:GmrSD restriction endonuclease domain-containing protein n=1 Tax=Paraburkholderia strydomiana TaxID=1245417 RepID=UPI001BEA4C52|nr:DUF262 domain-containing protein [Paraburkholderia strydomiana]MBT2791938.1 DUF262 domain-containing protein [Paraburkholderia strydomiana]
MQANLSIKGITVQNIYSQYLTGYYLINRRYQRKLVWSVGEKEKFIDSILNGFPIPMILGANYRKSDGASSLEVLDGMQRLNAITSFIEGEFSIGGMYFNLEAVAQTKAKKDAGHLLQQLPCLPVEECAKILDYPVPFSVFDENEPTKLDESFRRINTGGRTLSKQDVRQAGALGLVPELVNVAAIYIRKDSSHSNVVDLGNMKNISLSNTGLRYGINISDIFWAKHGIITHENIRMSRDEELVAHLLSYMADPQSSETTSHYLDEIYDDVSEDAKKLTRQIIKIGNQALYNQFCFVFSELSKVLDSREAIFKKLVYKGKPNKVTQVYQVVFIAFYKALISHNLKVSNYQNLCDSLADIFDNHLTALDSDRKWTGDDRETLSDATLGVIRKHFSPKSGGDFHLSSWAENFENILNQSKTEQVCYDFKMTLCQLSGRVEEYSAKVVGKIVKTLVAMTNAKPGDCYVIVGVAEKEEDAVQHQNHFDSDSIKYSNFFITGIDHEAIKYHGSIANLEQKIIQQIEKESISDNFKSRIKSGIVTFSYDGKQILLFKAARGDKPEMYDGRLYTRTLSHLEPVEQERMFDFYEMFKKESELAQKP